MRTILILAIALLLMFTASAKEELVQVGSYKASFNMDTSSPYKIDATPAEGYDGFDIKIKSEDSFADVTAAHVKVGADTSSEKLKNLVEDFFDGLPDDIKPDEIQYYKRAIDGQQAILGLGIYSKFQFYYAAYFKKAQESGYVEVAIASLYPWDDGTESLLNSLKVEYSPTEQYGTPADTSSQYGTPYEDSEAPYRLSKGLNNSYLIAKLQS